MYTSYICDDGIPADADGNTPSTTTQNCASCTTTGFEIYASTVPGMDGSTDFMACSRPYICTNGTDGNTDGNTPNASTQNCASCGDGYSLVVEPDHNGGTDRDGDQFMHCEFTPYLCTDGIPLDGDGNAQAANTQNCDSCDPEFTIVASAVLGVDLTMNFMQCEATNYRCDNGSPVPNDTSNPPLNTPNCASCEDDYASRAPKPSSINF